MDVSRNRPRHIGPRWANLRMPTLRPLVLLALAVCCAQAQLVRVPNSTLSLPPEPPRFGYRTEAAFGGLKFTDPVAIVSPPGDTNSLFVVEQRGRIAVITNLVSPYRTVFLDIASRVAGGVPADERGLLGLDRKSTRLNSSH